MTVHSTAQRSIRPKKELVVVPCPHYGAKHSLPICTWVVVSSLGKTQLLIKYLHTQNRTRGGQHCESCVTLIVEWQPNVIMDIVMGGDLVSFRAVKYTLHVTLHVTSTTISALNCSSVAALWGCILMGFNWVSFKRWSAPYIWPQRPSALKWDLQ